MINKYKPPPAGTWIQEHGKFAEVMAAWGVTDYSATPNVAAHLVNRNIELRSECAVTVRFVKDGVPVVLKMDDYQHPPTNLAVLRLCVNDMRMIERRGVSETMKSAYLQLAGPTGPLVRDPWEVLGVRSDAPMEVIEASFRALSRRRHPDHGGTTEQMAELNAAIERIRAERNQSVTA